MLVNPQIIEELCIDAGETRTQKAKKYKNEGRVEISKVEYQNKNNFEVSALVYGNERYHTYISVKDGEIDDIICDCPDYENTYGVCKHTLATILELEIYNEIQNKINKEESRKIKTKSTKYTNFKQMVNSFFNEEMQEIDKEEKVASKEKGTITIEPKILYDPFNNDLKVEFKIGNKRMYKIKKLPEFYKRMINEEEYLYGDKLHFVHKKEAFKEDKQSLLEFILKYSEIIHYANSNSNSNYRYYGKALSENSIMLGNTALDELFEILKGKTIEFKKSTKDMQIKLIDGNPEIEFVLNRTEENDYEIVPNIDIFGINIIRGKDYKYLLIDAKLYRITKEFEKSSMKLIETFRHNYITEVQLTKEDLKQLFSIIVPKVKNAIKLGNIKEEEIQEYKPKELITKVFLDFDKNNYLIADLRFTYGETEINPLDEKAKIDIPRNMLEEVKALNAFKKSGFMFDVKNLRFILPDNDKIYKFLTEDISYYMQKFEVMVTDNFKTKEITKPKIGLLGIKIENDLLSIDLKQMNINLEELQDVMKDYNLKKKYHRLKDGTFLSLENNEEVEFIDKLVNGVNTKYEELEKGEIILPVNRSLYLNQLLKTIKSTEIKKDNNYKKIVKDLEKEIGDEEIEIPQNLNAHLRYYQKIGFKWLSELDKYHFGGILADDMGLGKTIQLLAIILKYVNECNKETKDKKLNNQAINNSNEIYNQKNKEINNLNNSNIEINNDSNKSNMQRKKASIVISPSSLTLNWLNETKKFAPDLKTCVIRGTNKERKEKIDQIQNYDLVITSYDLLKRDIEYYKQKKYKFRFAIADEAQYLKNSNTQNAKAIKTILADTKFALTGTPIENSLAELWSIFDFIMPGYLFGYKEFKHTYEMPIVKDQDEQTMKKLKMLIEPFVLRRTKKEVLTELPEKTITVLNNEMTEEQEQIYLSYLMQAKKEVAEEINANGFEKSQIKILAALTRLRQICCHPKLFIENYNGECSKLDQCMEILEEGIAANHKILLFSTYTSMFEIIEKNLKEKNINYFKLTGATKVEDRIKMVDEFNENSNVKIFLISLKAGGTGLNLTGADMVIHYDPWWNLSAENQATDRAYRIGQKNNVQVYKLITKNSIEEKIYELQERKAKLAENMLNTNVTFVNKLSKEDIMELFG